MDPGVLADAIVAVHAIFVGFVVLGQVVILLGLWRGWGWVRNRWFRGVHLLAILFVALETIIGLNCPLTVWEDQLRQAAGQQVEEGTFIGRWLHALIFYDFPSWVFTSVYVAFAVLVLATFVLAPPRWRRTASQS